MGSRNSKARMVYWKISYCKQLVKCSLFAQLLFTWTIPNTDDLGRMEGDPEIIKGMMFPYHNNVSVKQIKEALQELADQKLITWYKVDENLYIELPNFAKYQKLRADRGYKSDYPPSDDSVNLCHDLSGQDTTCPLEVNRSEVNRTEQKKEVCRFCNHGRKKNITNWLNKFGEQGTKDRIENLNLYKGSKGVVYKSDYMTVWHWERKNKKEPAKSILPPTQKRRNRQRRKSCINRG